MSEFVSMRSVIEASYFIAAILFIFGLKRMSSPVTARGGIIWAGAGMVVATLVTFLYPGMGNYARLGQRQESRDDRHAADDRTL
jgi:NAD(P) transhydrogenase subunit beta